MMRTTLAFALLAFSFTANAGIIGTTNVIQLGSAPSSVDKNQLVTNTSNPQASIFQEKMNFTTTASVQMDVTAPGTYTTDPGNVALTIGTLLDSYYLHLDLITNATTRSTGSITFDTDVIGILGRDTQNAASAQNSLALSHAQLGAAGTTYWNGGNLHGIWDSGAGVDRITLSADRRTVSFDLTVGTAIDSVRILTQASVVPEPGSLALATIGLLGLARARRRS